MFFQAPDIVGQTSTKTTHLTKREYFNIMRKAWNFFKHAVGDHDKNLEFDPVETEHMIFGAIMNATELAPMSIEAQVFQLWYIATHVPIEDKLFDQARKSFGDLRNAARTDRLQIGAHRLLEEAR